MSQLRKLGYLFLAAKAVHDVASDAWAQDLVWMRGAWQGEVVQVLEELHAWQTRRGEPPESAAENDPRTLLQKTITYLENNRGRMKYPEDRREGLPVTTAWRESLVKEMNYRVKGTEMFWNDPEGAEALCRCGPRPSVTMSGWRSTSGRARVVPSHVDPSRPSSQRKKSEADVHPAQ